MKTNCYKCKFYKKTGFFDNKDSCFGGSGESAHVFIIGEVLFISDVGCQTFSERAP